MLQAPEVARRRVVATAPSPKDRTYTVKQGDTLESVSNAVVGTPRRTDEIRAVNREKIPASNEVVSGTVLVIRARWELINACMMMDDQRVRLREGKASQAATPSATDVPKAIEIFAKAVQDTPDFWKAADVRVVHDPSRVARWLHGWANPHPEFGVDRSINLGTWFGARCGGDRAAQLASLLDAKDSFVRVASAIYLSFEDDKRGTRALRDMSTLAHEP